MIGLLTGIPHTIDRNPVIVVVSGVGYRVQVTQRCLDALQAQKEYTFYIHTHVREDALDLYGFVDENELELFDLLLTVSGIGPKTALGVIDRGADAIGHAIREADVDFFTNIPRLGRKNAQKIIIELKNKLGGLKDLDVNGEARGETKQIMEALLSMGFKKPEIIEALKKTDAKNLSLEDRVRLALKVLG